MADGLQPFHYAFPVDDLAAARGCRASSDAASAARAIVGSTSTSLVTRSSRTSSRGRTCRPPTPTPSTAITSQFRTSAWCSSGGVGVTWRTPARARSRLHHRTRVRFAGSPGEQATMFCATPQVTPWSLSRLGTKAGCSRPTRSGRQWSLAWSRCAASWALRPRRLGVDVGLKLRVLKRR